MSHYIHHVPGRLRIKTALLKRNEAQACAVRALLDTMPGVTVAEVSTITGSVVINYDRDTASSSMILDTLRERGYINSSATVIGNLAGDPTVTDTMAMAGQALGKALFGVLMEKALEHSAMALIGAII